METGGSVMTLHYFRITQKGKVIFHKLNPNISNNIWVVVVRRVRFSIVPFLELMYRAVGKKAPVVSNHRFSLKDTWKRLAGDVRLECSSWLAASAAACLGQHGEVFSWRGASGFQEEGRKWTAKPRQESWLSTCNTPRPAPSHRWRRQHHSCCFVSL